MKLLFLQDYKRIKNILSQVLYYATMHPRSKSHVLTWLLQIVSYHMLNTKGFSSSKANSKSSSKDGVAVSGAEAGSSSSS